MHLAYHKLEMVAKHIGKMFVDAMMLITPAKAGTGPIFCMV